MTWYTRIGIALGSGIRHQHFDLGVVEGRRKTVVLLKETQRILSLEIDVIYSR